MASLFGNAWVSQYGDAPDGIGGDTWSAGLAGLTNAQIARGLQALTRIPAEWPPTVGRFRALALGIPSLPQARIELRGGNPDPSPFARLLWSYVDGFRYRQAPADQAEKMLRDAYDLAVAFVMDGGELPEPAPAIEQDESPPPKPASPEVARRYIEELQALFGNKPRTIQDDFADLERESEPDFRRRAAGDVE